MDHANAEFFGKQIASQVVVESAPQVPSGDAAAAEIRDLSVRTVKALSREAVGRIVRQALPLEYYIRGREAEEEILNLRYFPPKLYRRRFSRLQRIHACYAIEDAAYKHIQEILGEDIF